MTFLNKYKINIFLGLSILIFISIFSISSRDENNKIVKELLRLPSIKLRELKSSDPNFAINKVIKAKIDLINPSLPKWKKGTTTGKTILTYYIHESLIEGTIHGKFLSINAYSGGGALATDESLINKKMINNVCDIDKVARYPSNGLRTKNMRGGPIVPGDYTIDATILGNTEDSNGRIYDNRRIILTPSAKTGKIINKLNRRGGFRIHFKGDIGSDGCIVLDDYTMFLKLITEVQASNGGKLKVRKSRNGEEWACGHEIIDILD